MPTEAERLRALALQAVPVQGTPGVGGGAPASSEPPAPKRDWGEVAKKAAYTYGAALGGPLTVAGYLPAALGAAETAEAAGLIKPPMAPPAAPAEGVGQEEKDFYAPEGGAVSGMPQGYGAGGSAPMAVDHLVRTEETRELGHDVTQARGYFSDAAARMEKAAQLEAAASFVQRDQEKAFFEDQIQSKRNIQGLQAKEEDHRQKEIRAFQAKVQAARDEAQSPDAVLGAAVGNFMSGVGIALGAWQAMRSKGPNYALQAYNSIVEKQLAQQKQESQDTDNFYARMRAQFGDERQAELATRMAMDDIAKLQLGRIGAMAKSDHAKAQAEQAAGAISSQQAGWSVDLQKVEDGKRVQQRAVSQPFLMTRDGAHAMRMSGEERSAFAPQQPQAQPAPGQGPALEQGPAKAPGELTDADLEKRMSEGPKAGFTKSWAKVHNGGVMPEESPAESKAGPSASPVAHHDTWAPTKATVKGQTVLVQSPGARVAAPKEQSGGAVDAKGEPLKGEQLVAWRVQHTRRNKEGKSIEPGDQGKLSYEEFVKDPHNRELGEYIKRAPRIGQALQGMDISDATWRGYRMARSLGSAATMAYMSTLSDAERASMNTVISSFAAAKLKDAGKSTTERESDTIDEKMFGAGSFKDAVGIFQRDYEAKSSTYNTLIGSLNNDGLHAMYQSAKGGRGLPVGAQRWSSLSVNTGKKR